MSLSIATPPSSDHAALAVIPVDVNAAHLASYGATMFALVLEGPGHPAWSEVPMPLMTASTDAIVRVDVTTICGSDLHILAGDVPEVTLGRILGHEAVGTVVATGAAVQRSAVGDRVLVSAITSCGSCEDCRSSRYGQCTGGGGWILGHLIDGTQAEFVRVPFADYSTHHVPEGVRDEQLLMAADILPTAYEVGVLNGCVRPGDIVVVIGAGPVGLAAMACAQLLSPSHIVAMDLDDARLDQARRFGADAVVNNASADPVAFMAQFEGGHGADVVIEAVGQVATFELAMELVRPGGHVANIGVHGKPATLHLETLWSRDITLTTGLVDTSTTPTLLRLMGSGQLDASAFATHHLALHETVEGYEVFSHAATSGALKVILTRENSSPSSGA